MKALIVIGEIDNPLLYKIFEYIDYHSKGSEVKVLGFKERVIIIPTNHI